MSASVQAFPTIALIGRHASPGIAEPLSRLAAFLVARGHEVLLEAETAQFTPLPGYPSAPAAELGRHVTLAIVVGGDGTMLWIARQIAPFDVPLIGINQGRLGFLTDIALSDMETALGAMLSGGYVEETRTLLEATLTRAAAADSQAFALNEVAVNRGALGVMIDCAVAIDGRFVYAMRADGLIVATPTGSTAYALSAQGPIVDPAVAAILLVPVAPHALTNRPLVVRDSVVVEVSLLRGKDASLHCDGQANFPLSEGDRVVVRRAKHRVRLLHPHDHDHFAMLRRKLHWGETPERLRPGNA
ncbi:MAG: NAD kinase [Betaproteobacteria bacterium]|nr:MAG: NAD kinase [Betaproteobacteria bacterium]